MGSNGADIATDPLTDMVARILVIPLRELYAVLWRAGLMQIAEGTNSADESNPRPPTPTISCA